MSSDIINIALKNKVFHTPSVKSLKRNSMNCCWQTLERGSTARCSFFRTSLWMYICILIKLKEVFKNSIENLMRYSPCSPNYGCKDIHDYFCSTENRKEFRIKTPWCRATFCSFIWFWSKQTYLYRPSTTLPYYHKHVKIYNHGQIWWKCCISKHILRYSSFSFGDFTHVVYYLLQHF